MWSDLGRVVLTQSAQALRAPAEVLFALKPLFMLRCTKTKKPFAAALMPRCVRETYSGTACPPRPQNSL